MSKLPIKDPSIKVIPSSALKNFISSRFSSDSYLPFTIQIICKNNFKKLEKPTLDSFSKSVEFTEKEYEFMKAQAEDNHQNCNGDITSVLDEATSDNQSSVLKNADQNMLTLTLNDLKWLHNALNKLREDDSSIPYLHELIKDCSIILPQNDIQERNPELEARCQKLRKQQEAKEYQAMTRNVDNVRTLMPQDTIAYQMKQINRQLIAVAQFIFSVAAGFAFGFIGIELIIGQLDFGFRLLLGIMIALIIALAEIYFLAKKLNEDYENQSIPPETKEAGQRKIVESIEIKSKPKTKTKAKLHQD